MIAIEYTPQPVSVSKRIFDIVAAVFGLLITAPILPLIALVVKLETPGPALFRQQRIGRCLADRTELFWMYKFRTMGVDSEKKSGAVWAEKNDQRVTRIGRFLRKTRLDEIPQLWNVLIGDMSLIGPRPERPGFYQKLEKAIPFFAERTVGLRPGITGLSQVYQGYDRDLDDVRRKVSFDHAYALSLSAMVPWISMDLRIIVRTVWVMVAGRGQ
jgi:lipopolysaccharide/colanic/teichoic acid biosynthesis glycosyltransferase